MSLTWTGTSDLSYVSGDLIFTNLAETLNIKSNIIVNIPKFAFSDKLYTVVVGFHIKQRDNIFPINYNTEIQNEDLNNLEMIFSLNNIPFPTIDFILGLPFNIENIAIKIIDKNSEKSLYSLSSTKKLDFTSAPASCLLKGTKINTECGWKPIDDLNEGDRVLNQHYEPVEIVRKKSWRIKWGSKDFANTVYKIQTGLCGTVETTYISAYHKVMVGDDLSEAYTLGLPRATKYEICSGDYYVLYNIQLKNHRKNHFWINGLCLVESWDGSESGIVISTAQGYTVPIHTMLLQNA